MDMGVCVCVCVCVCVYTQMAVYKVYLFTSMNDICGGRGGGAIYPRYTRRKIV